MISKAKAARRLLLLLFIGSCASAPVDEVPVTGVRQDLSGIGAQEAKALSDLYIQQGRVFLYASEHTGSPIVEKSDIPFALQFKGVRVKGGFREALIFNGYMLEYMRSQLRKGFCPEHPDARLRTETMRKKEMIAKEGSRIRSSSRALVLVQKVFVCPVDKRRFIPYDLDKKTKVRPQ